jgi:hypothetical protein
MLQPKWFPWAGQADAVSGGALTASSSSGLSIIILDMWANGVNSAIRDHIGR